MLMQRIEELGHTVGREFRRANNDESSLPEIAARLLGEAQLHIGFDLLEPVRWLLSAHALPEQRHPESRFGNPPVTVYSGDRFYLELLFWLEGATAIHQHAFSGAFQVLTGSSIHCTYDFETTDKINSGMQLGNLALCQAELLGAGDIRLIRAGPSLIHGTFHLDRPTVTLVIRTDYDRDRGPQLSYRPPHLAVDPFINDSVLERRVEALNFLLQAKPIDYFKSIDGVLADTDLEFAYHVLKSAHGHVQGMNWFEGTVELARKRFGAWTDKLLRVLDEEKRRERLGTLRKTIDDKERRFVLAVVQNVPDLKDVVALTRKRYPDRSPESVIASHVELLMTGSQTDATAIDRSVLERMLLGESRNEIGRALEHGAERFDAVRVAPLLKPLWNP